MHMYIDMCIIYLGSPLSTAGSRLCDDISMFFTEKTKELSPKASLRWREGLFGGGVKRLLPSMGKHWLILKNFCEKKRPAHSSLITALHNAQQRAISYRKTMRSPERARESQIEWEREKLMRWITCQYKRIWAPGGPREEGHAWGPKHCSSPDRNTPALSCGGPQMLCWQQSQWDLLHVLVEYTGSESSLTWETNCEYFRCKSQHDGNFCYYMFLVLLCIYQCTLFQRIKVFIIFQNIIFLYFFFTVEVFKYFINRKMECNALYGRINPAF